jgi:hypothetical protein
MTMMNGAEDSFRPKQAKRDKTETTTKIAREIVDAEVAKREAKTLRLRLARLAREVAEPAKAPRKMPRPPEGQEARRQITRQKRKKEPAAQG